MLNDLKSWFRANVMYAALVLVFVAAWVADRVPAVSALALALAALVVAAQAALFFAERRDGRGKKAGSSVALAPAADIRKTLVKLDPHFAEMHWQPSREVAAKVLIMSMQDQEWRLREIRAVRTEIERRVRAALVHQHREYWQRFPTLGTELSTWSATELSPGVFSISANGFEITYLNGKTHIHVMDRSKVIVTAHEKFESEGSFEDGDAIFDRPALN